MNIKIKKKTSINILLVIFTFLFFMYVLSFSSDKFYGECFDNFQIELRKKTNSTADLINNYETLGVEEMKVIDNERAKFDEWSDKTLDECRRLTSKYNIYPLPIALFLSIIFYFLIKPIIHKFFN
jgi:hypothetical protein